MIRVDLHTHSTRSDGTMSPEELVARARRRGVAVLSLTDHDTTAGVEEFLRACRRSGVRGVAGVELSAEAPYTLHLLGYRFAVGDPRMEEALEEVRQHRDRRNGAICDKLGHLGVPVSLEEALRESRGEVLGRPHIAQAMIRKGYARDMKDAFCRYLGRGAPAYVPRVRLCPERCLELVANAGGVTVLAHPAQTNLPPDDLEALLRRLRDRGLWGLECYTPASSPDEIFFHLRLAGKLGLHATAGSDFHGSHRPGVDLGCGVEESLLPWARLGVAL
ncbi:MAG TPA: PHP domain-containing protein [Synergistaceae bacterium]|nr:PHP domain-containing protein [Synergistaceae bacterium]